MVKHQKFQFKHLDKNIGFRDFTFNPYQNKTLSLEMIKNTPNTQYLKKIERLDSTPQKYTQKSRGT
jgi:hypothetical protein